MPAITENSAPVSVPSTVLLGLTSGASLCFPSSLPPKRAKASHIHADMQPSAKTGTHISEIARLGVAMGGKIETFAGLTGIGDLIVTCASMHSRNRRAGILIGQGKTMQEAMDEVKMVVEGVYSAKAGVALAKKYGVELPIIEGPAKVSPYDIVSYSIVNLTGGSDLTISNVSGIVSGDDVTPSYSASYDFKDAGTSRVVTVTPSLSGNDSSNYFVSNKTLETQTIKKKTLTYQISVANKPYDGETVATSKTTAVNITGIEDGDEEGSDDSTDETSDEETDSRSED